MAASVVRRSRGGRQARPPARAVMSEINVTPFVDVMLVLLIVFMVSAPLLTVGVPIDLPQSQAKALNQDNEPLTVSVNVDGKVFLQDKEIQVDDLVPKLKAIIDARDGGLDERDLCPWRQESRLRYHDACDGPACRRPAITRRAGHRGRAGRGMRRSLIISGVAHAVLMLWGLVAFAGAAERGAAGRSRCRSSSSRRPNFRR